MKAVTVLWVALALGGTARAEAARCYYLWETQCFEIHDARTRDITHHQLITDGPVSLAAEGESCDARLEQARDERARKDLLAAFNKRIQRIDGCSALERLEPRIFERPEAAVEYHRRQTRPHERKKVHKVKAPAL